MAMWTSWQFITIFGSGGGIFLLICCITVCICRRRIAKRRIREALGMQHNYLQSKSPKASESTTVAVISGSPTNGTPSTTAGPMMVSIKSQSEEKQNVAEESDEESPNSTISADVTPKIKQKTISRKDSESIPPHPGIIDLSSDVVQPVQNNQNNQNGQSKRYPINYKPQDQGASPIMKPTDSRSLQTHDHILEFSPIEVQPNSIVDHGKHHSFVLESDVDYYSQMQKEDRMVRSRTGTASYATGSYNQNPSVIEDDDEDDDIEFDYGSRMDREREMTETRSRIVAR